MDNIIKNKANELSSSVENKSKSIVHSIARMHNPHHITIDSINKDGTITGRYVDGEVTTFNNKNLDQFYEDVLDSETNKKYRKLKPQIVSELTQKPVEQLTDDDFDNVANFLQQKTANDIFKANNGFNAIDKSLFESNLQVDDTNSLNTTIDINGQSVTIPINSINQSESNINRYKELLSKDVNSLSESELAEKKAIEQISINDAFTAQNKSQTYDVNSRYNEINLSSLNRNLTANLDQNGSYNPYVNRINITPREAHAMTTGEYWSTFAGKSFREGLAAVSTGILGLLDYYENEQEREAHKAEIVGYVPLSYRVAEQQAMEKAMAAMERGDILEAAWHAKFQVLPEIVQEAGELLITAIAMGAVTAATGGLGGAAAAAVTGAKLSSSIAKASKIGLALSKYLVAPVATSADQYLTGVATYEANNNEPMSLARRSVYMLGLSATNAVDLALIKQAGKIALGTAHKAVEGITDPVKKKMAKGALARYATATVGGGAGEGLQEYVQTIFDTSMTQNQADGKTLIEIALDPETQFSALMGAMVGGTMGGGANVVGDTLGKTFQGIGAGAKAVGSGISSVSSAISNSKAGMSSSKNIVQGLDSIEKSIRLANDDTTISHAETLVSNLKTTVNEGDYDLSEQDIHRINTLEAKLALKKEAIKSGSIASYVKDSSSFIKDFIIDFSDTVASWEKETDESIAKQQVDFLRANRGKIKALQSYIKEGRITVDKETENILNSAQEKLDEFNKDFMGTAEPDNDFIEELLDSKEDRFFYMYENADKEQKGKLLEIASQDEDLKHLVKTNSNGTKTLFSVRLETTKGRHGTNTYSEAINFYNKKLIKLERKAKKEDLTEKEQKQKAYYEGKIDSYKNTVIRFLESQVKKLEAFADIYTNPAEEVITNSYNEVKGVIVGRYNSIDPSTNVSTSFEVNKTDLSSTPSTSGSGKVIIETIDNIKRMNKLLKKRNITKATKKEVREQLQEANDSIKAINKVLSSNNVSELHDYIQIGNKVIQKTSPEATESSTINDNKKQVENTTKEEKTIVEPKKDVTEDKEKTEQKQKEKKTEEETNDVDTDKETIDDNTEQEETNTEPELVEEEITSESIEEDTTSEPVESEVVEEETQQVITEDETDSTSSNEKIEEPENKEQQTDNNSETIEEEKEKLFDVLVEKIKPIVRRLIKLYVLEDSFSANPELYDYTKSLKEEYEKAKDWEAKKTVILDAIAYLRKYKYEDSSSLDNIESNIKKDPDKENNEYIAKLEQFINELRGKLKKKSIDANALTYFNLERSRQKTNLKEIYDKIKQAINDGFTDSLIHEEAADLMNEVIKLYEKYTDNNNNNTEENTSSEAIESSVNEDSEEEIDNTTEEESLVTEPENEVNVEENTEVVQESNTTEVIEEESIDDINAKLNEYYDEDRGYFDEYEQSNVPQDNQVIQIKKESEEEWRKRKVKEFQDSNTANITEDSVLNFGKPRELNIQVGNETITFNSINHAIASLGHNKSSDPKKWSLNKDEYKSDKWNKKEERHKIDLDTFNKLNEEIRFIVISLAVKDLFFRDKEFRQALSSVSNKERKFVLKTAEEYSVLENKLEEIDKRIRAKYGDTPVNHNDRLATERFETLTTLISLGKDDIDLTELGIEYFIETFNFDINSAKESFDNGNSILYYNDLTNSVEMISPSENTGYTILPYDKMSKDSKDILDLLFMSGESSEDRITKWKSFFSRKEFTSNSKVIFDTKNPSKNKVITTFSKGETKFFEIITMKNEQEGGYTYTLKFLTGNEEGLEIKFNSHPILATKTKDHSAISRHNIREKYINTKDKNYGVTNLREDIDKKREIIKQLKSLWFGLNFFRDNFGVLAENTLTNKIEMIDKYLNDKVKKLLDDYTTLKEDLKTVGVDIDVLLEKSKQLRESDDNFNDTKILSFINEQLSTIGQAIDKSSLDIKTKESQIKATYKVKNAKKEQGNPNRVDEEIKKIDSEKTGKQFTAVFKTKDATTILPTTTEFEEEDKKIKKELENLFNKFNKDVINNNAAYFMLNTISNFALAIDFAVAELFYTNSKILNDPTVYMGSVINDLGKSVLNALGLQLNPATTSLALENQIVQDIGYLALNYAENMGYVETGNVSIDGVSTNAVKNTTNEYDREVLNHKYELLTTKPKRRSGTYSFEKEELPQRRESNPESESLQNANKKLMATPFRINYDAIDLIEQNRYEVQRALGWMTTEEIQNLPTKDLQISQVGINQQIEKSIDELLALKKEAELSALKKEAESLDSKPEYIYFNTFTATNTRMHIDSSTINPQNDKLHRFLFSPVSEEEDLTKEKTIDSDKLIQQFTYAIGQGLGLPVDKNTDDERSKWFDKIKTNLIDNKDNITALKEALLSNDKDKIKKIREDIDLDLEVEEFGHFLQALLVLENTRLEDGNVVVGTKGVQFLTVEHDSASSGLAIRILASGVFALNGSEELNKALGVYTETEKAVNSRNAFFKDTKAVDVYQTAAVDLKEKEIDKDTNVENLAQNSFRAGYKGLPVDTNNSEDEADIRLPFVIVEGDTKKTVKQDLRKDMFNDLKSFLGFSDDGKVSKALRTFMKSLVMPFGYQIGFSGALETATEGYINDLMSKFMTTTDATEIQGRDNFLNRILPYFEGVNNNVFSIDVKAIKITEGMDDEQKAKARELFLQLIKHVQYKDLKFTIPVALVNSEIKSESLDSPATFKYTGNENMDVNFSDIIQHTVMYMYTGTLYENLRTKFGELRGSAVFNSIVNPFSSEHRIQKLKEEDYIRKDKNGIHLAYRQTINKESVEKEETNKDGKIVALKVKKKRNGKVIIESKPISPNSTVNKTKEIYEIIFESPLLQMPSQEAKKILRGTGLGLTGLRIHSSNEIYLDGVEVELKKTSDSILAMKAVKTEVPINYKEQNLVHTKIQLDNGTTAQSNVTKALAIPLDVSISGSGARLAAITIHNLDAEIMAQTVNKNVGQELPVFDAIVSSPFAVNDSSTALNEGIYDVAMNTSIENRSLSAVNKIVSDISMNNSSMENITINVAEAQLIEKYLTKLEIDKKEIDELLKRKQKQGENSTIFYNSVEINIDKYKEMLEEAEKRVKELKKANEDTVTVANVDGIDGTAYNKAEKEVPNQDPKTEEDTYNYFYSQGPEEDKNDFEDVMFSDNDAEARLNLFDTLVGDSHVDTTGWFAQVKELLQSLGSLRLNSLGVRLIEGMGIHGEYKKSNHTVYLERSTIPNTTDRYRHPAIRYAHELVHAIMVTALDQAGKLGITKEVSQLFDLYNIASKHLTPEDFLPEYYNNREEAMQEARAVYDYIFSNSSENSQRLRGLNEFIAYALTDERLARKLQSIMIQQKSPKKQSLWSRLKEIVRTIFNIAKPEENKDLDGLMANLVDVFTDNKDLNAFEALQNLVQKIVDADNKAMQQAEEQNQFSGIKKLIYTAGEKAIIPANKTIGGFIRNLITLTDNAANYDKLMSTLQNETGEHNLRTRLIATSKILLNVLTSSKARKKLPQVLNYIGLTTFASYNFVGRWIDEMKEADEYKRTIEDNARAARKIDQNAQGIKNITISQLTELFKDENRPDGLSEEEKAMLTDIVLKLDLSCINKRDNGKNIPVTANDLKDLMTDNKKIDETISSLRQELSDVMDDTLRYDAKTKTLLFNKITMLADYLVTGNVYVNGATNARSVRQSTELETNTVRNNMKSMEVDSLIDQLASLIALRQIPLSNRQQVASMNTEGLDAFLNIHRVNKENDYNYYLQMAGNDSSSVPYAKAYDNLSKGFTKVISNNSYDVVIGYASQAEFYNQKGFKPIPDVIAGEISGEKLLYYKNGFNSKSSRNGSAYVYTGFDKIGKSMMLIAEEDLNFKKPEINFAGMKTRDKMETLSTEYTAKIRSQTRSLTSALVNKELSVEELRKLNKNFTNVYPVYDHTGNVQDYSLILPKAVRKQLSITDDAFRIMGEMVATNLRREQGNELNQELLRFIFNESDTFTTFNNKADANAISHDADGNRWIPITPDSFDPFARQMWEELDSNLRRFVIGHMKNTGKPLYIREDALLDVFGQKDIAVANVITRNLPVFRQAIQVLGMIVKFVATEYKGLVVIKTPQVLIGNVLSNVALAIVQGINPVDIIKSYITDFRAIQDYEKTDRQLKELQFKVGITNDINKKLEINKEIEILKSKQQNNPVHELMNLGYKQTIVEDISNTDFDNSSYFDSKLERARKTLPRPLVAGFDILFMTKRTAGYQFMHKMTGYSDLLARSVEYKHKKKEIEKKHKVGTVEYEEAMSKLHGQLSDNYINYDKPQSAVEQWLNDMGLVLFTKFFKRIQSVIVNHAIDNPLGVATFLAANTVVDMPNIFETSIAVRDLTSYTHNPIDFIEELITPPMLNLISNGS